MQLKYLYFLVFITVALMNIKNVTGFDQHNDSTFSDFELPTPSSTLSQSGLADNETGLNENLPPSPMDSFFPDPAYSSLHVQPPSIPLGYKMMEEQSFRLSVQLSELEQWKTREIEAISNRISGLVRDIKNLVDNDVHQLKQADERKQTKLKQFEEKFMTKLETFERETNTRIEQGEKEVDKTFSALSQLESKKKRAKRELKETLKSDKEMAKDDNGKVLGPLGPILGAVDNLKPKSWSPMDVLVDLQ